MYNLVFSDGTGQSGTGSDGASTNVYKLYLAAPGRPEGRCFYDPGVGTDPEGRDPGWRRKIHNLLARATGFGVTQNIRDCYDFLIQAQRPGRRIGLFGFSRGAYTVRSVGGVLGLCGLPHPIQDGIDLTEKDHPQSLAKRAAVVKEAVDIYQTGRGEKKEAEREQLAGQFCKTYRCADAPPHVIGVFDTVAALGWRGISTMSTPLKHEFHNNTLSDKVPFGLQALSVDENRKVFQPVIWEDAEPGSAQIIDQQWFPGVHSDIGGGYEQTGLSDLTMMWMADQCRQAAIGIRFDIDGGQITPEILGQQHDERGGMMGWLWSLGTRENSVRNRTRDDHRLCDPIEDRFESEHLNYRPKALENHPRVRVFYGS